MMMVPCWRNVYRVPPFGIKFLAGVLSLSFLPLIVSEEIQQPSSGNDNNSGADDPTILFQNCEIEKYYESDGEWGWERVEIASLLLKSHRQVVPSDAVSEFLSGEASANTPFSRQYASKTDIRTESPRRTRQGDGYEWRWWYGKNSALDFYPNWCSRRRGCQ